MTKITNLDPPGVKAFDRVKGRSGSAGARTPGVKMVDASGNEATAAEWQVLGATITDNDDETAVLTIAGLPGSGTPAWINVKDYGALGDGTTIDCSAINDAIDDLNATDGGVLYFPPGHYICNTGLNTITVPAMVRGEGIGSPGVAPSNSRITCTSATANLFEVDGGHVAFYSLDIRNSAASPSAGAGIAVTGSALTTIRDCMIKGFWINVDIQESGGQNIDGCWFVGPVKYALKIRNISSPDGGDHAISNCFFYSSDGRTADAAIREESAGGTKITNCKFNYLNASGSFVNAIDIAPAASTSILLVHGNSIENVSGDGIHIATSGFQWDHISVVGNQFGLYANATGNAIDITCANLGEVDGVVISSNIFRQNGGGTAVAVNLTKVNDVTLVGNVYELGFAGGNIATSGCTNVVNLDLLGATPSGELGGTWDAITVDTTHSGSAHLALGSTSTTAAAGNHTHASSVPPAILLESGSSTPFTFDEILQESDGSDFLWASA